MDTWWTLSKEGCADTFTETNIGNHRCMAHDRFRSHHTITNPRGEDAGILFNSKKQSIGRVKIYWNGMLKDQSARPC